MKFPYSSVLFLGMLIFSMMFLRCSPKSKTATIEVPREPTYTLKVERGAFHYDSFLLEGDTLRYIPEKKSNHSNVRYNIATRRVLDSSVTNTVMTKIREDGFWELNHTYKNSTTCNSQLRVTLKTNEKTKTVTCDDFERDCPDLIKYIERKVIELEGNGLKRIYLPG